MSLDRRRILHVNVTKHETAEWVAHQMVETFPGDGWVLRFLQRNRDGAYGWAFRRKLKTMGMEELVSAPRSPWQTAYVERLIGCIRRECTDHIIPMGAVHPQIDAALSVAIEALCGPRLGQAGDVFGRDNRARRASTGSLEREGLTKCDNCRILRLLPHLKP